MTFPVDLSLLDNATHMPAMPLLQRSMGESKLQLQDFCIPVNPYFPTPELMDDLSDRLVEILKYYPSDNRSVADLLGELLEMDGANLVVANGSTELITWINQRFVTDSLVTDVPTFGRWTDSAAELGRSVHPFFRRRADAYCLDVDDLLRFTASRRAKVLAICNPNNPTGAALSRDEVLRLLDQARHLDLVVIDESFVDFVSEETIPTVARDVSDYENVVVIKSLGKNLGLHGLRCGYAVAGRKLADQFRRMLPPWNVNSLAEEFIRVVVARRVQFEAARRRVIRDSQLFFARLEQISGMTVFPANANFVYCELDREIPGRPLRDLLLRQWGCFIRECGSKIGSGSQFLRIATRPPSQQQLLLQALPAAISRVQSDDADSGAVFSGKASTSDHRDQALPAVEMNWSSS